MKHCMDLAVGFIPDYADEVTKDMYFDDEYFENLDEKIEIYYEEYFIPSNDVEYKIPPVNNNPTYTLPNSLYK